MLLMDKLVSRAKAFVDTQLQVLCGTWAQVNKNGNNKRFFVYYVPVKKQVENLIVHTPNLYQLRSGSCQSNQARQSP